MIALVLTIPANRAGAADADTCGVRLPRRISDRGCLRAPDRFDDLRELHPGQLWSARRGGGLLALAHQAVDRLLVRLQSVPPGVVLRPFAFGLSPPAGVIIHLPGSLSN